MPSEYEIRRSEKEMIDRANTILSKRFKESDEIAVRCDPMSLVNSKPEGSRKKVAAVTENLPVLLDIDTLRAIFLMSCSPAMIQVRQ